MWIIDRFEDRFAVLECEDGTFEDVPREALPPSCRAGSVLRKNETGAFELDHDAEEKRRDALYQLQNDLFS